MLLFEDRQTSPLLARTVENIFQREQDLREQGIQLLLCRLAKGVLVDNYLKRMRKLLDRLQNLVVAIVAGGPAYARPQNWL